MRRLSIFLILCFFCFSVFAQEQRFKGYPQKGGNIDLRKEFLNPPKGYGNVPFYWWNGDSLNRDRLLYQLDILRDAAVDGFAVSYMHTNPEVDVEENKNGYGGFGRSDDGKPGAFSKEWWDVWNWFSGKCAEYGIGIGLDDYTLGWPGNDFYVDELLKDSLFANYPGKLRIDTFAVKSGSIFETNFVKMPLDVLVYPGARSITKNIKNNRLTWKAPIGKESYKLYVVNVDAGYELHPEYGKRLISVYFDRFKKYLDAQGQKGMNYFFQDELEYHLSMLSWSADFQEEFKKRKKYDILPYLPALVDNIGDITAKIRLDYAEVITQLSEERYFKPIFDWHAEQGLIYGCDNYGRGLDPISYVDYFRATSWFTAPGNDAPARGSSFRQTKVSSSVAHLYERPRTWLEAFHSMGWDSNGEWLTEQLDHHILAGGNLLCLHGLYYSTHGGWWEWAPPCFHFRMPYWSHMKLWLKYAERLSYLLSQGNHVCDIAVMYPVESLQAYPQSNINNMWSLVNQLSSHGLDYDFIDFQSLQSAKIDDKALSIAGERYKILILADMKAMHHATLLKVLDFYRKGGIVIATGNLPVATTNKGENDLAVEKILKEIFYKPVKDKTGIVEPDVNKIIKLIPELILPDFKTSGGRGRVLHRRIGQQDVYMVANVAKGDEMFFRSTGKAECWDAKTGGIKIQPIIKQDKTGTWVRSESEANSSKLIVFSPGTPDVEKFSSQQQHTEKETIPVTGNWDIEIIPTMDNKWGDFRLPATNEYIGPEARDFTYKFVAETELQNEMPNLNNISLPKGLYGYAPYMETLTLPASTNIANYIKSMPTGDNWQPYCFSWQYGVFDIPGSQGYHGLKGKVDNRFIILDQGGHQLFRTFVYAPEDGMYQVIREGVNPDFILIGDKIVTENRIKINKGWHLLLLAYQNTEKIEYNLVNLRGTTVDNRPRSFVALYPEKHKPLKETSPYDHIVASKWYLSSHLQFDPNAGKAGRWYYQFQTAPATEDMKIHIKGDLDKIWIDGKEIDYNSQLIQIATGVYSLKIKNVNTGVSNIVLRGIPEQGYHGPAFFIEPIKLTCGKGQIPSGDWTQFGGLKYFSGGIRYTKQIDLKENKLGKITLDLGSVDATCEVKINGKDMGTFISPPYQIDVTEALQLGGNEIEVLVYSSLSNHYQEIPSAYKGTPRAGLFGPVRLVIYE